MWFLKYEHALNFVLTNTWARGSLSLVPHHQLTKVSDGKTKNMSPGVKIYVKEPLEVETVFSPAKTNLVKAMSQ